MEKLSRQRFGALMILSIVIPVGLLVSLRTIGLLNEPGTPETTLLEPIEWELQRPNEFLRINKELNTVYADDNMLIKLVTIVGDFVEGSPVHNGADYVTLGIKLGSTMKPDAIIKEVFIFFRRDSEHSLIEWLDTDMVFENVSIQSFSNGWTSETDYKEAYILLAGVDQPSDLSLSTTLIWYLLTPNNKTHDVELAFEITYFDGIITRKIIQSFTLKIIGVESP